MKIVSYRSQSTNKNLGALTTLVSTQKVSYKLSASSVNGSAQQGQKKIGKSPIRKFLIGLSLKNLLYEAVKKS